MAFFSRRKPAQVEERGYTQSSHEFLERMGISTAVSAQDVVVTTETALMVPAVWAAVNFISSSLAGLPLKAYRKSKGERVEISGGISDIINKAPNDEWTSYDWRKYKFQGVFTGGRGLSYVERNNAGRVANIWPIEPATVTPKIKDMRKTYERRGDNGRVTVYSASEIIDIPFMLRPDMAGHYGPISKGRESIGMAIAAVNYASKIFQGGGLPPATLEGPYTTAAGAARGAADVAREMAKMALEGRSVLPLPQGHSLKSAGFNAKDMQLIEMQRFCIEQVARVYSLPPVFLQDLTHGTFSNTEQQDLHLVKHTLKAWIEQTEQQLDLKLFGRGAKTFCKFSVDGLLRGDIKTRMEAHAQAIQNAIYTPAYAASMEDKPHHPEADKIMIQGGTMPIGSAKPEGEVDE